MKALKIYSSFESRKKMKNMSIAQISARCTTKWRAKKNLCLVSMAKSKSKRNSKEAKGKIDSSKE